MLKLVLSPHVLVPLLVLVAITGAVLPWIVGYSSYGQSAMEQQIDRDDSSLCTKLGLASETPRGTECKTALADLRRQHELLLLQ
ncbi:MAG TPA: hypothetical protein VGI78_17065 [Acetobacteraceae bacterium]|jgi:hypothetical protein